MVGGVVIFVYEWQDRIEVHATGTGCETGDICGVYISKDGPIPIVGDGIWWQMDVAFVERNGVERQTKKIGYSFDPSFDVMEQATGAS